MKSEEWIREHKSCLETYLKYAVSEEYSNELIAQINIIDCILEE